MNELNSVLEARKMNEDFPQTASINEWKARGGKVIGFTSDYVPEEIIHAADILPIAMISDEKIPLSDADLFLIPSLCSYSRTNFQLGYNDDFDFLDGIIIGATCDGQRRLFDAWKQFGKAGFSYLIEVPMKLNQDYSKQRYKNVLKNLIEQLNEYFGVYITDEALKQSIRAVNTKRKLLQEICETRKVNPATVSGTEMMEVMNAGLRMPIDQFIKLLKNLLSEIGQSNGRVNGNIRLMICGAPQNNVGFISAIEDMGAIVVVDELRMGSRQWVGLVEEVNDSDPLDVIVERYHGKLPEPTFSPYEKRLDSLLSLAEEYKVDGVISNIVRHCIPHTYLGPVTKRYFETHKIPLLELETEYSMQATGQIKTRVQAFFEIIEERRNDATK